MGRPQEEDKLQEYALSEAERILGELAGIMVSGRGAGDLRTEALTVAELPDLQAIYQNLVEQIPAVVFMVFLDQRIGRAYVSPHIEQMLGFSQSEWLDDPIGLYRRIYPADRLRWSQEAAHMFITGQPLRSVYRVSARDGKLVWFRCEAKMVRDSQGRPWYVQGVGFDISDLKRAEESLRQAHDELEERVKERTSELARANRELQLEIAQRRRIESDLRHADRLKDEFLATVSHELRTPLTAILGWTRLLRSGRLEADKQVRALEIVERNAHFQTQLIQDLLDFSAMLRGQVRVKSEPVDLGRLLDQVVESAQPAARAKGLTVGQNPQAAQIIVDGDSDRLQQIFWNLLSNSVKFTPAGGNIRLEMDPLIDYVEVRVIDDGIGISSEFLPHVFDSFRQEASSPSRAHGGLGLGLSIVRHLVELHGGEVEASSPGLGKGTTFRVRLPYRQLSSGETASP